MASKQKSPARKLLEHVWEHANTKTAFSWERLNHSMSTALTLAVGSGMTFVANDWNLSGFNAGRWIGGSLEGYYRLAVIVGNRSAIESYEEWANRKPIIADDVDLQGRYIYGSESCYTHGGAGTRKRERLVVGCRFPYRGNMVEVTSFTADGAAVCCAYKPKLSGQSAKILHRYVLTAELIQADRAERKAKNTAIDALQASVTAVDAPKNQAKKIAEFLNIPKGATDSWLLTLPIEKLQAAVDKFCCAPSVDC